MTKDFSLAKNLPSDEAGNVPQNQPISGVQETPPLPPAYMGYPNVFKVVGVDSPALIATTRTTTRQMLNGAASVALGAPTKHFEAYRPSQPPQNPANMLQALIDLSREPKKFTPGAFTELFAKFSASPSFSSYLVTILAPGSPVKIDDTGSSYTIEALDYEKTSLEEPSRIAAEIKLKSASGQSITTNLYKVFAHSPWLKAKII